MSFNKSKFKPKTIAGTPADAEYKSRYFEHRYIQGEDGYAYRYDIVNQHYVKSTVTNRQLVNSSTFIKV